jgi:ankyrin repeat protein
MLICICSTSTKTEFDRRSVRGSTPIQQAADFGHVEIIRYLVSKGAKVNAKDNFGNSALLNALYENHTDAVKELLKAGADASVKGPDGRSCKEIADKPEIKALFK